MLTRRVVRSRSHHGHHARFISMVTLSNSTMLRVTSSQTAPGSARVGWRCCVMGSRLVSPRSNAQSYLSGRCQEIYRLARRANDHRCHPQREGESRRNADASEARWALRGAFYESSAPCQAIPHIRVTSVKIQPANR
jgi:hypothetical protein